MSNNLYDERIHCIPGPYPTDPMWIPGRPPYEHPGGCCPDAPVVNPYNPGVPNPVPTRYFYPVPPCGPWPHHPEKFFVLKRQLNEILKNIAKADIYQDKSETGTTIRVGGIAKGTKLGDITFSELVAKLLFPSGDQPVDPEEYVKMGELEYLVKEFLATVAVSGSYDDLTDKPTIPSVEGLVTIEALTTALGDYVAKTDMATYLSGYDYIKMGELEDLIKAFLMVELEDLVKEFLATVAVSGSYDDLTDKPTIPSLTWPEDKLHDVVNGVGGFKVGDDLTGMSIVDIIETLLCKQPNP